MEGLGSTARNRPSTDAARQWGGLPASLAAIPRSSELLLYYLAYMAVAGFGQWIAVIPGITILLWPPNGVVLATLMLNRAASWPWWLLAAAVAELTCNALWFHNPLLPALGYVAANACEALFGVILIARFGSRSGRLDTLPEVVRSIAAGVLAAPMIGATIGSAIDEAIGKHPFAVTWPLWWLGDATGILIAGPLVIVAVQAWRDGRRPASLRLSPQVLAIAASLGLVATVTFAGYAPFVFLFTPVLLWASVRYEFRGAALSMALIAVMTGFFAAAGRNLSGPELLPRDVLHVLMQLFLMTSAVTSLVVAAVSRQQRRSVHDLLAANADLETRVQARTEQLEDKARRLEFAIDACGAGTWELDAATGAFVASARARALHGVDAAAALDHAKALAAIHPEDQPRVVEALGRSRQTGAAFDVEMRVPGADSSVRWLSSNALLVREGSADRFLGIVRDITERKLRELALAVAAERAEVAQQAARAMFYEFLPATGIGVRTPAFTHLTGYSEEEMPAKANVWLDLIHPDDAAAASGSFGGGTGYSCDYRVRHKDGHYIWVHDRARILRRQGEPERVVGMVQDITEQKEREEKINLLMGEVNHRSKNMLALVMAIARQSAARDPQNFLKRFEERIQALSASQDLLVRDGWSGVDVEELVRAQLAHFSDLVGTRIAVRGPRLRFTAAAAQGVGLALHELSTNAGKYGALSAEGGRVDIGWGVRDAVFSISWTERDGPPVTPPASLGFGSKVIGAMVRITVGGAADLAYEPTGVVWRLTCPAAKALDRS